MKQRMVGKSTSARKGGGPTTPRNAEKTRKAKSPGFSLEEVNRIKEEREARRNAMKAAKEASAQKAKAYKDAGIVGDVDFLEMIDEWHATHPLIATPYLADPTMKLVVCVRKRPLNSKELSRQVHDCLTVANPYAVVHESQLSVDGYKYLKHLPLQFDYVFDENSETEDLYTAAVKPLVDFMVQGGHSTVFAYGQTGSGKTHTMGQTQALAIQDLFKALSLMKSKSRPIIFVASFEIYGPKIQDLLNNRERLDVLEDENGLVSVVGLAKVPVSTAGELTELLEQSSQLRTTQKTDANDASSRSHSVTQIFLHPPGDSEAEQPHIGVLTVVDLAGSERGQDTKSHSRQLRTEGAEINKSLLALKECIRAMQKADAHVSFRASKLTQVLKFAFTSKKAKTAMVATVSPAADSADHTINTLRYADRVKEKKNKKIILPIDTSNTSGTAEAIQAAASDEGDDNSALSDYGDDTDVSASLDTPENSDGYAAAVEQLNKAEENLLACHITALEKNAQMCVTESKLLAGILDKDVVDYDIDLYAEQLESIILARLSQTNELQKRLGEYRKSSRTEEAVSRRLSMI